MNYLSKSEKETTALAKQFVASLKAGETVGLIGELGAGKTAFVKGVAKALRIKQRVNSPTFVLMRVYKVAKHSSIKHLVHVDAYRLHKAASLSAIGLDDYIEDPSSLVLIEWADRVKAIMPKKAIVIRFKHTASGRRITLPL